MSDDDKVRAEAARRTTTSLWTQRMPEDGTWSVFMVLSGCVDQQMANGARAAKRACAALSPEAIRSGP